MPQQHFQVTPLINCNTKGRRTFLPILLQAMHYLDRENTADNALWSKNVPGGKLQHYLESGDTQWETMVHSSFGPTYCSNTACTYTLKSLAIQDQDIVDFKEALYGSKSPTKRYVLFVTLRSHQFLKLLKCRKNQIIK